jgi:hypothetical protein
MKFSKRITALFTAILMAITVFSNAIPAFAKSPNSKTLTCGSYKATCSMITANKYSGMAITSSASKDSSNNKVKFDTLCTTMFGTKVDKNGDNPKYISSTGTPKYNVTSASEGIPTLSSTGGYYYAKMVSAHIAIKNGVEKSTTLNTSY